jgi:hypothetical protein
MTVDVWKPIQNHIAAFTPKQNQVFPVTLRGIAGNPAKHAFRAFRGGYVPMPP